MKQTDKQTPRPQKRLYEQKVFDPLLLSDDTQLDLKGAGPGWGQ